MIRPAVRISSFLTRLFAFVLVLTTVLTGRPGLTAEETTYRPAQRHAIALDGTWKLATRDNTWRNVVVPIAITDRNRLILQKAFLLDGKDRGRKLLLSSPGLNYSGVIRINDQIITGLPGGAVPFSTVIEPEYVKFGAENTVQVELDNRYDARTTLPLRHRPLGWSPSNGLVRPVTLTVLPDAGLEKVDVHTSWQPEKNSARLVAEVTVRQYHPLPDSLGENAEYTLEVSVITGTRRRDRLTVQEGPFPLASGARRMLDIPLTLPRPALWSPENPARYPVTVRLLHGEQILDEKKLSAGVRSIALEEGYFVLNGRRYEIRGVDWISSLDGLGGQKLADEITRVITKIKSLGANTVRVVGSPPHPQFVEKCSEKGLFVLAEIPVYYATERHFRQKEFTEKALGAISAMVRAARNQPAILAWGLAIDAQDTAPASRDWLEKAATRARSLDDRPVYLVTRSPDFSAISDIPDFFIRDVIAMPADAGLPAVLSGKPVLPLLGAFVNMSAISREGNTRERRIFEAEELQADELLRQLRALSSREQHAGYVLHALQDWRGDQPFLAAGSERGDTRVYPGGLLRENGVERVSYAVVSALNNDRQIPHISPNTGVLEHPVVFPIVGVSAILVFLFFLNRDRRLRGHLRRIFIYPHGFYTDLHENRKVPRFLTYLLVIIEGVIWAALIAGGLYALRENLLLDEILNLVVPGPQVKGWLVYMIWNPGAMVAAGVTAYFILMAVLATVFKLPGLFMGENLPWMQFFTFFVWSATCYLPLAFIAPIFYRLLVEGNFITPVVGIAAATVLWHVIRIIRGIRVLYVLPTSRAVLIFVLLIVGVAGSVAFYYNHDRALFAYIEYYAALLR